jgi:acetyltransferase
MPSVAASKVTRVMLEKHMQELAAMSVEKRPRTAGERQSAHIRQIALRDGAQITFRPIRLEDEPALVRFHRSLSDRSVYFRYFHQLTLGQRISHERLARICSATGDQVITLVAETNEKNIVAVGRLMREPKNSREAEFSVNVSDAWQDRGVGSALLEHLIVSAREEDIDRLAGFVLADNFPMLDLCRRLGFTLSSADGGVIDVSLNLRPEPSGE